MEYHSDIKQKAILLFQTTWTDPEGIILSEINQRKKRQILYGLTYTRNLKKKQTHRNRDQICSCWRGERIG